MTGQTHSVIGTPLYKGWEEDSKENSRPQGGHGFSSLEEMVPNQPTNHPSPQSLWPLYVSNPIHLLLFPHVEWLQHLHVTGSSNVHGRKLKVKKKIMQNQELRSLLFSRPLPPSLFLPQGLVHRVQTQTNTELKSECMSTFTHHASLHKRSREERLQ